MNTIWANAQPITGPRPEYYMSNETRKGIVLAYSQAVYTANHMERLDGSGRAIALPEVRSIIISACHRAAPTDARRLHPLAEFWLN